MDADQRGLDDVDGMVLAWRRTTASEPWHCAPERFGDDAMIPVIDAILDVTLSAGTGLDANERLVRAASAHGDQRRLQGVEESAVFDEYRVLGTALWSRWETTSMEADVRVVIRLDRVLRIATSAAIQGYHRSDRSHSSWGTQLKKQIAAASASLATLFRDGHDMPAPAYASARTSGVGACQPQKDHGAESATREAMPPTLVDARLLSI